MKTQKLPQRIIVYIAGLFVLSIGAAFTINSDLGVSPIMSLPYVLSFIFDAYMGTVVTIVFLSMILVQIIILRKKFKWINLTQIIFSIIYGYFVDFGIFLLGDFQLPTYFGQLIMLFVGIILISLGIVLFMEARLVPLSIEGTCDALTQVFPSVKFHVFKIIIDSVFTLLAIVLALVFLGGLEGIREGTVIAAVLVGKFMPPLKKLAAPVVRWTRNEV